MTHLSPGEPTTPTEYLEEAIRARWDGKPPQPADGVLLVVARGFEGCRRNVAVFDARSSVRAFTAQRPRIEDAVGYAYGSQRREFKAGIQPSQIPSEIEALLRRLILPEGEFGGGYTRKRRKLYRAFARRGQRIELLRRDSHDLETVRLVHGLLAGRGVDLLFIDGDHTYEGVSQDYASYASLVRAGGLIAIHDIVPGNQEDVGGVPRFWKELKQTSDTEEIVRDWNQGGFGIGLVTRSAP